MKKIPLIFILLTLAITSSCDNNVKEPTSAPTIDFEKEKKAIIEAISNETKAASQRDYESWKSYWVHDPNISKTYINFTEDSFSEMIGWKEIDDFVRVYIEEHPEPVLPPPLPKKINVKLYHNGAWLQYDIMDEVQGLKRETRLMEKENGVWKIAGMHTSIYGFKK